MQEQVGLILVCATPGLAISSLCNPRLLKICLGFAFFLIKIPGEQVGFRPMLIVNKFITLQKPQYKKPDFSVKPTKNQGYIIWGITDET